MAAALSVCIATVVVSSSSGLAAEQPDSRRITAQDFRFGGAPRALGAGILNITLVNRSTDSPHLIEFIRLAPGHEDATKAEAIAAADQFDFCPSGCFFNQDAGGAFADTRTTSTGQATFSPGTYVYFCFIQEPDGTPHYHLGMFGFVKVHPEH